MYEADFVLKFFMIIWNKNGQVYFKWDDYKSVKCIYNVCTKHRCNLVRKVNER